MKDQKSLSRYRQSRLEEFSCNVFYCSLTHGSGFYLYEFPGNSFPLVSLPFALLVVRYHVDVHTGQLKQAETESDVSLCLFGERGDSGLRLLYKSNMPVKFQRGQVRLHKQLCHVLSNLSEGDHVWLKIEKCLTPFKCSF